MEDIFNASSWVESKEERDLISKDEFLTLAEGDNQIRLIGKYIFRNVHYNPEWKMKYISCCGNGCPICEKGDLPKLHYYINVIDRKSNTVKIMKFGITLKRKFQNLNAKYGDLTQFDIIITRTGTKLDTKYEVLPTMDKRPLTEEEKTKVLNSYIDLDIKFQIPSPKQALSMMYGEDISMDRANVTNKVDITTVKTAESNGPSKECFGEKYNPMNQNCKVCELLSNCKKLTIENLSK